MSAAKKLKSLSTRLCETGRGSDDILAALPQILAVVKAAERTVANGQLVCDEEIELDSALAALDDALTADGKTPK